MDSDLAIETPSWIESFCSVRGDIADRQLKRTMEICESYGAKQTPSRCKLSCYDMGLQTAELLYSLGFDNDSICAAMVCESMRFTKLTRFSYAEQMGVTLADLAHSTIKLDSISYLSQKETSADKLESIRRELIDHTHNIRTIIIKLAEQVCLVKESDDERIAPEKRLHIARQAMDIYAPLANRLGILKLKIKLENIAFSICEPASYREVCKKLGAKQSERENYINSIATQLKNIINDTDDIPEFHINSRAKHAYSVHSKMLRKNVGFDEIYDELAIRILVPGKIHCYKILETINEHWEHVPDEFDDYILHPKKNGYQSIHTALIGPAGRHFEVQIRTYAMHEQSEFGFSAHCLYKENRQVYSMHKARVLWLRQIIEWSGEIHVTASKPIFEEVKTPAKIYVFTSQGYVCELPEGATALDYAYHIDDDFAKHSIQARINGRSAKLNDALKNGDEVDVATSFVSYPREVWLKENYAITELARSKISEWLEGRAAHNSA